MGSTMGVGAVRGCAVGSSLSDGSDGAAGNRRFCESGLTLDGRWSLRARWGRRSRRSALHDLQAGDQTFDLLFLP